jgi:hypothetical protein
MSSAPQYEFSTEENALIGNLAGKMSFVGLFLVLVGVVNVLMAILVVVAIYRDRIPSSWMDQLPAEAKEQVKKMPLDKLPANNNLWGIAINAGLVGLFYLLMGTWTRTAAADFKKIVTTQGNDISHLMNALGALHSMYALVYTLLMVTLLVGLAALALVLYSNFAH